MTDDHPTDDGGTAAGSPVAVVGIGVSAPAFRSLEQLFALIPGDSGAAFVIVSESAAAIDTEALAGALAAVHGALARMIEDGEVLEADRIYIAPVGMMTTLDGRVVRLSAPQQGPGHRGTIDTFLISLAEQQRGTAVAIIPAALNGAGSIGVARLKECGGLAMAEAEDDGTDIRHPDAQPIEGASGMVDIRVPLAEIAPRLIGLLDHLRNLEAAREASILEGRRDRLPIIATILRNQTGHDFHGYKPNTFLRRIQRRMHVMRVGDLDAYIELLRTGPDEVRDLFQDLLIGVTQFFRDPGEFEVLEHRIIPELLRGKKEGDTLRVWVLGCSTGEEAYSLAMLIQEAAAPLHAPPHVQIFATDIDARALAVARTGRYPESIERDVPAERLARWFTREGGTYAIHKDLREMCVFSSHNVIKDAPFSRVDLISCRNLLIYLNAELQERVIPLFHFALRPGGHLFLGPSENVTRHARLFQPVDRRHRIFRREETALRVLPHFPLTARPETRRATGEAASRPRNTLGGTPGSNPGVTLGGTLAKRAERLAERYAPAYVVIDEDHQVLNFSGRTGPFLDPSSGAANLNLLNLVHRDLRLDLRAALHRAGAERRPARVAPVQMGSEGDARRVGMTVEPLSEGLDGPANFVVLFHDHGSEAADAADAITLNPAMLRDEHVTRLEGELSVARDRLRATIEELESTNEELKSSNEEYQSINEELQSANEELETSKEELQSVNEELQTVNGVLAHRIGELAHANGDLKNLLESTQIATLFLDNDLRVRSFTPSMSEVFHLIEGDLGRPITHIASRVPYPELDEDVRRVLRTLSTVEREIGLSDGGRYLVRVLPYRSVDNFIAGTVLTFLDITATTVAQAARQAAEGRTRLATSAARIIIWELDLPSGGLTHSEGFETAFTFAPPPTMAALIAAAHPADRQRLSAALGATGENGVPLDIELRIMAPPGEVWVRLTGTRTGDTVLGVLQDVDERRRSEAKQVLLMTELQHRVKNILGVVRSITRRSLEGADSLEDFAGRFSGRLDALARTQGVLASHGTEGVMLEQLVRDELAAGRGRDSNEIEISGPPILLKDRAAEVFALGVHELTTNAVKHGALSKPEGRLVVGWRIMNTSDGRRLALEWQEHGVALREKPARTGFGRRLIERGLPYDLGAITSLEFGPDGVRCTMELPLGPRVIALNATEPHPAANGPATWQKRAALPQEMSP